MQARARARYAFAQYLGECGKRCTPERLLVLDMALERRRPFMADELQASVSGVSRATLFNTLPLLVRAGILRHNVATHTYETVRSAAARKARLNLVCSHCGKIHHRGAADFATWLAEQNLRGFMPTEGCADIYVYGECDKCRRRAATKLKNSQTKL